MFAALALAMAVSVPTTIDLTPTDDVWVYPHASDAAKDPFLRIWGADDLAVPSSPDDLEGYSFGYLRFDLSSTPKDAKLTAATLTLTHVADPAYTTTLVKNHPLEVRPVGSFEEKTWAYENVTKVMPNTQKSSVYGSTFPEPIPANGKPFTLEVNLLKGPGDLKKALGGSPTLCLALVSSISPEDGGRSAVYKVYSKDADEASYRPKLTLVYE